MKKTALILGILISTLLFSQNRNEVVDVVYNGKIQTQEDTDAQTYVARYLTEFFQRDYDKRNGFYLVVEEKTSNNRNTLQIDELRTFRSKDIKNIILKKNGNKFPTVIFEFNKKAAQKLEKLTSNNVGNGIAIIVDRKIVTMPMISQKISDGKIEYNSALPYVETEKIINKLK